MIAAFRAAFAPGEGPRLLLRSINGDRHMLELESLRYAASDRDDITVLDGYLDAGAKDGLMCECDCYVSLHRSEGLGLTMAEAMAAARPVIATAYSGNLDFMNSENSMLVPVSELRLVGVGSDPYPLDAQWAEPDLDAAARLMRQAVSSPDDMARLGERARTDVLERFSLDRTAAFIAEQVERIRRDRRDISERPRRPSRLRWPGRPAGSRRGPRSPGTRRRPLPRRRHASGLLRAMGPYLRRRAEFDVALVQSDEEAVLRLDHLAERIDGTEQRLEALAQEDREHLKARLAAAERAPCRGPGLAPRDPLHVRPAHPRDRHGRRAPGDRIPGRRSSAAVAIGASKTSSAVPRASSASASASTSSTSATAHP